MSQYHSNFKDYFKILQVDFNAEKEVISAAYKALMKKYHPDSNNGFEDPYVKEINEAYEVLSDPVKMENYKKEYVKFNSNNDKLPYFFIEKLKKKEEELTRREINLKLKEKILKHINKFSNENSNYLDKAKSFIDSFISSDKINKQREIFSKINDFDNKEEILKELIYSKLSLTQELIVYEYILDRKIESFKDKIGPAFKFKPLYPKIFDYILTFGIKDYKNKIEIIASSVYDYEELIKIMNIYLKIFDKDEVAQYFQKLKNFIDKILKNEKDEEQLKRVLSVYLSGITELNILDNFDKKFIKKLNKFVSLNFNQVV